MAGVFVPASTQKITVKDASGRRIEGYSEIPLIQATVVKYCQTCVEFKDQECTHVNTIQKLENQVGELSRQMDSTREDCQFQVNYWRRKYIELFSKVSRANRCQMCLGRPYDAITLSCGHLICDDCIEKYLRSFEYLLDPLISHVACPLPHPRSRRSDSDDNKYYCDHIGGALDKEGTRRHTSLSVQVIEGIIDREVDAEERTDEYFWELVEKPNLLSYQYQ